MLKRNKKTLKGNKKNSEIKEKNIWREVKKPLKRGKKI